MKLRWEGSEVEVELDCGIIEVEIEIEIVGKGGRRGIEF